jgi:hypothetical protein
MLDEKKLMLDRISTIFYVILGLFVLLFFGGILVELVGTGISDFEKFVRALVFCFLPPAIWFLLLWIFTGKIKQKDGKS